MELLLNIYLIGCVVALVCGIEQAHYEKNANKDISDLPAAIVVIIMSSWWYVYHYFKNKSKR